MVSLLNPFCSQHTFYPDKIPFDTLKDETREDRLANHRLAYTYGLFYSVVLPCLQLMLLSSSLRFTVFTLFRVAEEVGIYPMLEPEDMVDYPPDKKCVLTYMSEYVISHFPT